jgi:hypothetical protein
MTENSQNKNSEKDEIDLLELFRRMGKTLSVWGRGIGGAILASIFFLLKRWLPLGISIVLGIGVSFYLQRISESLYTSDLVLRTNPVSTSDMITYINRLQKYSSERNDKALAEALSLTPNEVKNIVNIGAFWIIDRFTDGIPDYVDYKNKMNNLDTANSRMLDRFDIRVITRSTLDLPKLRDGIIKYINSDSLFQRHNRLRLRHNQELITRLNYDILQLDSLQKVKYFEETRNRLPQSGGQIFFLQEQKTQLVYADIYALYSRKQALEAIDDLYQDIVTIISDFTVTIKRMNGISFYRRRIIPIFFAVTLLFLVLVSQRRNLKNLYNKFK